MGYDKNFYECLAKLTLETALSEGYGDLHHAESPDLQGRQLSIGIEVTRSVSPDEARGNTVIKDVSKQLEQLEHSLIRKLEKLNSLYTLYKSNRLFIFAETDVLNSQNIVSTIRNVYKNHNEFEVKYDVIYVDCEKAIYIVQEKKTAVKKVSISEADRKKIRKRAQKLYLTEF